MKSPREYEKELERQKQNQIGLLKSEKDHKIRVLETKLQSKKLDNMQKVLFFISGLILFIPIFGLIDLLRRICGDNTSQHDFFQFFWALGFDVFISSFIAKLIKKKNNKRINMKILVIEEEYAKKVSELDVQTKELMNKYLVLYKNKVNEKSISFANSELAKEIIGLLSNEFARNINALSRTSNIQFITYTYSFRVYYNKITSDKALWFDFDEHRCRNLDDVTEQEALAKILATQVQLNTMMNYSEDPSGTPIKLNINYVYPNDQCVEVRLEYVALNGNYEQVRNW